MYIFNKFFHRIISQIQFDKNVLPSAVNWYQEIDNKIDNIFGGDFDGRTEGKKETGLATIIQTEIKVNFDDVLALETANAKDSRYIMGAPGCESLPDPRTEHKVHGYYRSSGDFECWALPMIPAEDIAARVQWWTNQAKPKGGLLSRLFG